MSMVEKMLEKYVNDHGDRVAGVLAKVSKTNIEVSEDAMFTFTSTIGGATIAEGQVDLSDTITRIVDSRLLQLGLLPVYS